MPIQLQAVVLGGVIALVSAVLGAVTTHWLHLRRAKEERRYTEGKDRKDWIIDELRASIQNEDDARLVADLLRQGAVLLQPPINKDSSPERISRGDVAFGCLPAGTMVVMSDGKLRPIQEVEKGDLIRSFDCDTREILQESVKHIVSATSKSFVVINGVFEVTSSQHVLASGKYQQADQLRLHHDLSDGGGCRPILSLELRHMAEAVPVFCLVLESGAGYYVQPDGINHSIVIREGETGKTGFVPLKVHEESDPTNTSAPGVRQAQPRLHDRWSLRSTPWSSWVFAT
jgi:hypothetical protein